MRQTIFAIGLMSAVGIRKWGSGEIAVEDLKGVLRSEGPHKLRATMQSLLQSGNVAGWTEDTDALETVLTSLNDEILVTLSAENLNQQSTITTAMNAFERAIEVRELLESASLSDESTLSGAVASEKVGAFDYDVKLADLKSAMSKASAPCASQESLMDYSFSLSPQTLFVCDFSASSSESENCDLQLSGAQQNASTNINNLNSSLTDERRKYQTAESHCLGNISAANTAMGNLISAYNAWQAKRVTVGELHQARRDGVCVHTVSCKDDLDQALQNSDQWEGVAGAYDTECAAMSSIDMLHTRTNTANNSDSLLDRNYELESVKLIECLITRLMENANGSWEGENESDLVDQCQSQQNYTDYTLEFITTSNNDATSCVQISTAELSFTSLQARSKCSALGTTLELGGSSQSGSEYVNNAIPRELSSIVFTPDDFTAAGNDGTVVECAWWCGSDGDCLDSSPRTLGCTGSPDNSLPYLADLGKVSYLMGVVPGQTDYVGSTGVYTVDTSGTPTSVSSCQ